MRHTNLHINIVKQPAKTTHWLFDFSFPSNGCSNRFRYLILMYNDEQAVCNDAKQNLHFTAHTSLFQSISTVRASWASCFRYLLRFWFEFLFVFTSILYFVRFKCILTLCYNIRIYSYALEKNVNCAKYIFKLISWDEKKIRNDNVWLSLFLLLFFSSSDECKSP